MVLLGSVGEGDVGRLGQLVQAVHLTGHLYQVCLLHMEHRPPGRVLWQGNLQMQPSTSSDDASCWKGCGRGCSRWSAAPPGSFSGRPTCTARLTISDGHLSSDVRGMLQQVEHCPCAEPPGKAVQRLYEHPCRAEWEGLNRDMLWSKKSPLAGPPATPGRSSSVHQLEWYCEGVCCR